LVINVHVKVRYSIIGLDRPYRLRRLRVLGFMDNQDKKVVCQPYASAAFTSQEISPLLISVRGSVDPTAIMQLEGLSQ
jgi:hypothetical protein